MGQAYNFLIDKYDVVEYMQSIHAANPTVPIPTIVLSYVK
jgi:hypothetical protein